MERAEPASKTGLALALELTDLDCRLEARRYRRLHPGSSESEVEAHTKIAHTLGG